MCCDLGVEEAMACIVMDFPLGAGVDRDDVFPMRDCVYYQARVDIRDEWWAWQVFVIRFV